MKNESLHSWPLHFIQLSSAEEGVFYISFKFQNKNLTVFSDNGEPYGGRITTSIYFILNCNLVEAFFLYFSFKAIKAQTEISQDLIGPTQYKKERGKKTFEIVIPIPQRSQMPQF